MADKKISELPASSALDLDDFLAVVEDGTTVQATIEDILALSTASGLPDGYSVPAFTPAVLTNQTTTMTAAIAELDPDTGGTVLIPAGTFYTRILPSGQSGVTFRGAGSTATTIVAPTTSAIIEPSGTPRGNYTFEDMTFDVDFTTATTMPIYPDDHTVTFRRCRFINIGDGYALGLLGSVGTVIEDCEFDDGGTANGTAVFCATGVRGLRWIRSTVRFMRQGIVFDSTPHDEIDIDGGLFDGGFYLLPTRGAGYTNSGGTVTYSATVLTDSAASFGAISAPWLANVRALTVLESGSTGTTYVSDYLNDSTATFITAVVRPGYIVRTATKWAVVARVTAETRLYVEEWFDSTTYRPTSPPAAAAAYTVYRVLLGNVQSNTATTVTVERWYDFHDGATVLPPSGTLYEVLIDHGGYTGIHASAAPDEYSTGSIRRIRVHGGCRITRVWNDALSIYGRDSRLVVEPSVLIEHGQDFGITSHGDQARIFCTVVHCGAVGIYTTGDDCQINAFASGSPWVNAGNVLYLGDILISGSRTRATGSVVVASGAHARWGFVVGGPRTAGGSVDAVDLSGTSADGYSTAEYRLYSTTTPTVTVTNTVLRDVAGVISEDGASGSVAPAKFAGLATLTSRYSVPGCFWAGASVSTSMTLDTIWYEPFVVYSPITVTDIGIRVITPAAGGSTARLNIYSANSAWQPVARMISDGTVAIDAGALVKRSSLATTLQPGMYLAAYNSSATASIRTVQMSGVEVGSTTDAWDTHIDRMSVASAYAAMPATGTAWTTGTAVTTTGVVHGMWMKWTS